MLHARCQYQHQKRADSVTLPACNLRAVPHSAE